jgi:hypothetical protein
VNLPKLEHAAVAALVGFGLFNPARAAQQQVTVEDMNVFYGVVPAEMVQKRAEMHPARVRKNYKHLVVALVDRR